jgi:hypothetical protein
MRSSGTDCLVVVTKRGNARGAKGTGDSRHDRRGQLATGGTARSLRRERQLSLNGKSRVSREAQARFREGLGVQLPGATRPPTELDLNLERHFPADYRRNFFRGILSD